MWGRAARSDRIIEILDAVTAVLQLVRADLAAQQRGLDRLLDQQSSCQGLLAELAIQLQTTQQRAREEHRAAEDRWRTFHQSCDERYRHFYRAQLSREQERTDHVT